MRYGNLTIRQFKELTAPIMFNVFTKADAPTFFAPSDACNLISEGNGRKLYGFCLHVFTETNLKANEVSNVFYIFGIIIFENTVPFSTSVTFVPVGIPDDGLSLISSKPYNMFMNNIGYEISNGMDQFSAMRFLFKHDGLNFINAFGNSSFFLLTTREVKDYLQKCEIPESLQEYIQNHGKTFLEGIADLKDELDLERFEFIESKFLFDYYYIHDNTEKGIIFTLPDSEDEISFSDYFQISIGTYNVKYPLVDDEEMAKVIKALMIFAQRYDTLHELVNELCKLISLKP